MNGTHPAANDVDVDLGRLFASLKESWRIIAVAAVAVAVLAFVLASLAPQLYRGETRLLIEMRESIFTRPQNGVEGSQPILDSEGVASQVQVIASTDILMRVADQLDLAQREEFGGDDVSVLDRLLVLAGIEGDPSDIPSEQRILDTFREKLEVYRVADSRVIVIAFSSEDPQLAADVPNAVADTYIAVQRQAKEESNTSATQWLRPEIEELRQRVKEAESKVADYRASSDLLIGDNNTVLSTQQLSQISSELSRVRANRAAAEAKATAVRSAIEDGASLETLPDVLASGLIQNLRERQVQLRGQIADLSTTLLENHPRIRSLRSQLAGLDEQISVEARKVLEGFETEVETARIRERELTKELNQLKVESADAGGQEVELRALEREAAAERQLLESYLTRFSEASSRGERNYLPVDARIFSRALAPSEPYYPKVVPITIAAFAATLLLACVVILLRELFSGRAMRPAGRRVEPIEEVVMPAAQAREARTRDGTASEIGIDGAAERLISGGAKRALFVSPEGDEAAASAVLVAREVADAGLRVMLVDLTPTAAASRPMLESASYAGMTNLLTSEAPFSDVIHADLYSTCHVIPIGSADLDRAMRAADRLPIVMRSLNTAYDVVIVECGAAHAEEIARLVEDDTLIMVSVLESGDDAAAGAVDEIRSRGLGDPLVVTPAGHVPHPAPPGRSAA